MELSAWFAGERGVLSVREVDQGEASWWNAGGGQRWAGGGEEVELMARIAWSGPRLVRRKFTDWRTVHG